VAAELDDGRLVEESCGVEQQSDESTAAEPGADATEPAARARDEPLLAVGVLLAERRDAVVEQRHAGAAVERDEERDEQRTQDAQQDLHGTHTTPPRHRRHQLTALKHQRQHAAFR